MKVSKEELDRLAQVAIKCGFGDARRHLVIDADLLNALKRHSVPKDQVFSDLDKLRDWYNDDDNAEPLLAYITRAITLSDSDKAKEVFSEAKRKYDAEDKIECAQEDDLSVKTHTLEAERERSSCVKPKVPSEVVQQRTNPHDELRVNEGSSAGAGADSSECAVAPDTGPPTAKSLTPRITHRQKTIGGVVGILGVVLGFGSLSLDYRNRQKPPPTTCVPNKIESCGPNAQQACASDGSKFLECVVLQHSDSSVSNAQAIGVDSPNAVKSSSTVGSSTPDPGAISGVSTLNRGLVSRVSNSRFEGKKDTGGSRSSELPATYAAPANTNKTRSQRASDQPELPPALASPANTNKTRFSSGSDQSGLPHAYTPP